MVVINLLSTIDIGIDELAICCWYLVLMKYLSTVDIVIDEIAIFLTAIDEAAIYCWSMVVLIKWYYTADISIYMPLKLIYFILSKMVEIFLKH